jgi:Uma2 family endonuclease
MATQLQNIPQLQNGDSLTRPEFERRYATMTDQKAELIEGIVYVVASPLRFQQHAEPHAAIIVWLGSYQVTQPLVRIGVEPTVCLDMGNEPQPDAVLFYEGGQARLSEDDYIEGAPELVVEVAASRASMDLHQKKQAYQRNGVREYLVWRIYDHELDWFSLRNGEFVALQPDQNGIIRSEAFEGLCLVVEALLAGNIAEVLRVLQQGIN